MPALMQSTTPAMSAKEHDEGAIRECFMDAWHISTSLSARVARFSGSPPPRYSSMVGSWDGLRAVGDAALTVGTPAGIGIIGVACDGYHQPPQPRNCPPMVELRLIAVSSVKVTKTPPKQGYISTANATKLYFSVVRVYFAASLARGSSPPKEILISTGPFCLLS